MAPQCRTRLTAHQQQPGLRQAEARRAAGGDRGSSEDQVSDQAEPVLPPTYDHGPGEPLERGMETGEDRERDPGGGGATRHQAAAVPDPAAARPGTEGAAAHYDSNPTDDDKVQWAENLQAEQSYRTRGACPVCREEEEARRVNKGFPCGSYLPRPLSRLVYPSHYTWLSRFVQWIITRLHASQVRDPLESKPLATIRQNLQHNNVSWMAEQIVIIIFVCLG